MQVFFFIVPTVKRLLRNIHRKNKIAHDPKSTLTTWPKCFNNATCWTSHNMSEGNCKCVICLFFLNGTFTQFIEWIYFSSDAFEALQRAPCIPHCVEGFVHDLEWTCQPQLRTQNKQHCWLTSRISEPMTRPQRPSSVKASSLVLIFFRSCFNEFVCCSPLTLICMVKS